MRLNHPVDDGGYGEIRQSVEELLAPEQGYVQFSALEDAGVFEMLDEVPLVAPAAIFEGQGARLGVGATVEAFVAHGLRAEGVELPEGDLGILVALDDRLIGFAPPTTPSRWLAIHPGRPGVDVLPGDIAVSALASIDPSVDLVVASIADAAGGQTVGETHGPEARYQLALALQLAGLCDHILTAARDYSKVRVQFGRPISSFQAVQALLADAATVTAAAQAVARTALDELRLDPAGDRLPLAALVAAGAGLRALTTTTRSGLQVFGAVGYTAEHEFPGYYRRGQLLAHLLSSRTIDARIAVAAVDAGVPELFPVEGWGFANEGNQVS